MPRTPFGQQKACDLRLQLWQDLSWRHDTCLMHGFSRLRDLCWACERPELEVVEHHADEDHVVVGEERAPHTGNAEAEARGEPEA